MSSTGPQYGLVEPDTSSLWLDLLSLDSVILIIATCSVFFISQGRFFGDISWQVLKIAFRNPQMWKFSGERYPQNSLHGSCLRHSRYCHPPPGHKQPSDGPVSSIHGIEMWNYKKMENDTWGQPPPKCFMKLNFDYFQHYSSKLVMLGQIDVHFNLGWRISQNVTHDDVTKTSKVKFKIII